MVAPPLRSTSGGGLNPRGSGGGGIGIVGEPGTGSVNDLGPEPLKSKNEWRWGGASIYIYIC